MPLQPGFRLYCIVLHYYYFAASLYKHKTRPTVTDVPWSVCVCLCVYLLVTTVSPTKTDEPIEMPFLGVDPGGHKKPRIGRDSGFSRGSDFFEGGGRMSRPFENYREYPT